MDEVIGKYESEVRSYSRAFPNVFAKATGPIVKSSDGRDYIDFFSGAGGLNYGHNQADIKQAMIDYLVNDGIIHGLDMATEAKISFIDIFEKRILQPRNLDYKLQFTGPTGTNSVEAAIKLARLVTGRTNIIAFTHSFHGVSLGALAATSSSWFRNASGIALGGASFFPYDGYLGDFDTLALLAKMLDDPSGGVDKPAAVIVEAIQGEGGVNIASREWLQSLRELTSERGILLIIDDIQAGCGRSGDFFSFEDSGIVPDMVTLSKSLSASGLPMSLLLIKPEYDKWKPAQHNGTFRGNNLAFVSAAKAIEIFWSDDRFSMDVKRKGDIVMGSLNSIAQRYPDKIKEARGRGMFCGIEFIDPTVAKKVATSCFEKGLIIELCGARDEVLKLFPALNIDDNTLLKGLEIIESAVASN